MRDRYDDITALGAGVVAIGTGDVRYAANFVAEERIRFPVLVDDDGEAARLASVRTLGPLALVGPASWRGSLRAHRAGHRVHKPGPRVTQLGATFVAGPGPVVHYEHIDAHSSDHAPVDDVLAALAQ